MAFFKSRATTKHGICILLSICFAGLMLPSESKNVAFKLPSSNKLTDGDTPQSTVDKTASPIKLAPLGLYDHKPEQSDGGDGVLKSTVSQNEFKARSQAGSGNKNEVAGGQSESVVDKKKLAEKLKAKPKAPDVGPIALHETEEEAQAKVDAVVDAERRQMGELWQCTIDRNPDIQFVIQKLQPNSDANHAMASTMKFLTMTLCGAMNMAPFMLPGGAGGANPAAMLGMGSGSSLLTSMFQDKAEKGAKKQAISQEQATILYKIVRDTADKLVASYRDYKKENTSLARASNDFTDLKAMVAEARQGQSPTTQIEMEYTLRKAKRDIDEKLEQARLYRQQLTDLAGADAVAKLDKDMLDEHATVELLTATPAAKPAGPPAFVNPLTQLAARPQAAAAAASSETTEKDRASQNEVAVQPVEKKAKKTKAPQQELAAVPAKVKVKKTKAPQSEVAAQPAESTEKTAAAPGVVAAAAAESSQKEIAVQSPTAAPVEADPPAAAPVETAALSPVQPGEATAPSAENAAPLKVASARKKNNNKRKSVKQPLTPAMDPIDTAAGPDAIPH
jgi:hypothetical protein